jgi:hypothetical protein
MHDPAPEQQPLGASREGALRAIDRLASFRLTYAAIFLFLILYVFTVKGVEAVLDRHFRIRVAEAVRVDPREGPITAQIESRLDRSVDGSRWVRVGGVQVTAFVLGADGRTPLYVGGHGLAREVGIDPIGGFERADRLLPASTAVVTSVPHNSLLANAILVAYAAMLIQSLFLWSRTQARREEARLRSAIEARDATAMRAGRIEGELEQVRRQLLEAVPEREGHAQEIRSLEQERARLRAQLESVTQRERELRSVGAQRLEEEHQALEELLDEALVDLEHKDEEIRNLQSRLKKASRPAPTSSRSREATQLGRRLRTLYKNLEIDDRAIQDLVALGDETMKLKAEESLKRLSEETESALVRRKVGGLPPHLSIFELGFGGKGRIYYTGGRQRRHRILTVGAKNTQKQDLDYLSRLPRENT